MSGSTVNLLSASLLTQEGVRCVFEAEDKGGSYLLLPGPAGNRRKVPLTYSKGLYLLQLEHLYNSDEAIDEDVDDLLSLLSHALSHEDAPESRAYAAFDSNVDDSEELAAYSVAADLKV